MTITQLEHGVFDPEAIAALAEAFRGACDVLRVRDDFIKEALARRIVGLARAGLADADKIRDQVVSESRAAVS